MMNDDGTRNSPSAPGGVQYAPTVQYPVYAGGGGAIPSPAPPGGTGSGDGTTGAVESGEAVTRADLLAELLSGGTPNTKSSTQYGPGSSSAVPQQSLLSRILIGLLISLAVGGLYYAISRRKSKGTPTGKRAD